MSSTKQLYTAIALQEEGKTDAAEAAFKKILKKHPNDFVSLYSLGVICYKRDEYKQAIDLFDKAKQVNNSYAPLWYNIGITQQKLGNYTESFESLQKSLQLDSTYQPAQKQIKSYNEAIGLYSNETKYTKNNINNNRLHQALGLQSEGKLKEAEELFLQLLEDDSASVGALYSLGVLEAQKKNPDKALLYIDRALKITDGYAPLWYNKAVMLQSLKKFEEALDSYDKAICINSEYVEALINRGAMLVEMKRHKDALMDYERLLTIDPDNEKVLSNRGIILTDFKLYDKAIETFSRLVSIAPEYDYALGLLAFAKLHACDWSGIEDLRQRIIEGVRAGKRVCKSQAFLAISDNPMDHLMCARIFAQHYYPIQSPIWKGEVYKHKKIKIAYISPDFREHPVGHLTAGIFENHDKERFEIIAISLGIDDNSKLRARMATAFDKFIDVRKMSSRDIAVMMKDLEIDIAVDLGGYTADTRSDILAYRPAPIQINFLGYSSTMGAEFIDYIIADRVIIPGTQKECYSEKILYMPDCFLPTDASVAIADEIPSRSQYGLPENAFIFCSFNHDYKINPEMFAVWMRLLKAIPGSVLWLMKLNEFAEHNLLKEAEKHGVTTDRIVFATRVPRIEDHLARYQLADLFLDTTPYNAHTTTSDVLRAGLPVLTCMSKAFAGRVAASLLHTVGLPEMITESLKEYEERALQLAMDAGELNQIRGKLKGNIKDSALYDTQRYCRNLEGIYSEIHNKLENIKNEQKNAAVYEDPKVILETANQPMQGEKTVAILIPIYKDKLDADEQFAIDFLTKNVPKRTKFFVAPKAINQTYYQKRYGDIEFRHFDDKYFVSIKAYNHLLLGYEFYNSFKNYDYILIHQTDALMFHDNLDYWMSQNFDYIGAPWPTGVEVKMQLDRFAVGEGLNLKAYVGNGGFSLRSVNATIAVMQEFKEIREHWIKSLSSEDLFFSFMGMLSDSYKIPNQIIASRFALEAEPEKYYAMNGNVLPTGCHAGWRIHKSFWSKVVMV